MKMRYKIILIILCLLFALSTLIAFLTHGDYIDSRNDVWFESNTLFVLIFIFVISRNTILDNGFIKYGFLLLIFNQAYDVITEINYLDAISDRYDLVDTMIEDGSLQIAYLLIAFGFTKLIKQINEEACIDELTGLYNRKKLSSIRMKHFDLIYLDLDGLKKVNDSKGHAVGDLMIIRFAQAINQVIGRHEQAFRVGGDEFVIVVKPNEGQQLIDRLEQELQGEAIKFSYGIEATSINELTQALEKTDQAMYEMKNSQRNH
ncbi:GGDEF family protein [Vibrio orientalis CIP 102891 = ATCC 33934]|uniref:diguanylate cyclase n=1 Tax=Vibrio orientalis CIP 102891 = ATCC 33934 TaxID=675816 RepID=C9QKN1_VIBOR|nr:GGDEF domain-containing protein [Vibrio orientalis]EEX92366.1 GGDEF family protein [Vibrio orientalis CIP 102891 = ATCC 33934]EGU51809.1 GGDEF family protein [Vibrio orientalis CIP 102891 = ATCC 33934]